MSSTSITLKEAKQEHKAVSGTKVLFALSSAHRAVCHNMIDYFVFRVSTEHTRVELADGALMDIFCSMYSVSCKVLNNLYHYFLSAFAF